MAFLVLVLINVSYSAVEFTETIRGSGEAYSRTDAGSGHDRVNGMGDHTYFRHLKVEDGASELASIYTLNSSSDNKSTINGMKEDIMNDTTGLTTTIETSTSIIYLPPEREDVYKNTTKGSTMNDVENNARTNRYSFSLDVPGGMKGKKAYTNIEETSTINDMENIARTNRYSVSLDVPGGIKHLVEVNTKGSIASVSTTNQNEKLATSSFYINSSSGNIVEEAATSDERKHAIPIAQSRLSGKFDVQSQLTDKSSPNMFASDADRLRSSLESADVKGEVARQENFVPSTVTTYTSASGSVDKTEGQMEIKEGQPFSMEKTTNSKSSGEVQGNYEGYAVESSNFIFYLPPTFGSLRNERTNVSPNSGFQGNEGNADSNGGQVIETDDAIIYLPPLPKTISPGEILARDSYHLGGFFPQNRNEHVGWKVRRDDYFLDNVSPSDSIGNVSPRKPIELGGKENADKLRLIYNASRDLFTR